MGKFNIPERLFIGIVSMLLLFFLYNYDVLLGQSFLAMVTIGAVLWVLDEVKGNKVQLRLYSNNVGKSIILSILGVIAVYAIGSIVVNLITGVGSFFDIKSIITLQSEYLPVFAGSAIFSFIGTGILIPISETFFFFGSAFELGIDSLKAQLNFSNPTLWLLMGLIGLVFLFFHLTAKLLSTNATSSLIMVFIFAMVSMTIVVIEKNLLGAILMHITLNSIAILSTFGISLLWIIGSVAGASLLILYLTQSGFNISKVLS